MDKKIIISNYDWNLEWISMVYDYGFFSEDIIIYDRSKNLKDWSYIGKVIETKNVGANQYDILSYIVDNYENLPDRMIFIKGNLLFNREKFYYTTEERFISSLTSDGIFSIWVDKWLLNGDTRHLKNTKLEILEDGRLNQPLCNCDFSKNSDFECRYFSNVNSLLKHFFINPPLTNHIEFIPASNFAIDKKDILKYSKKFYFKIKHILDYLPNSKYISNVCAEAHLVERIFYYIWSKNLIESDKINTINGI